MVPALCCWASPFCSDEAAPNRSIRSISSLPFLAGIVPNLPFSRGERSPPCRYFGIGLLAAPTDFPPLANWRWNCCISYLSSLGSPFETAACDLWVFFEKSWTAKASRFGSPYVVLPSSGIICSRIYSLISIKAYTIFSK